MEDRSKVKLLGSLLRWLKIVFWGYILGEVAIGLGALLELSGSSSMYGPGIELSLGEYVGGLGGLFLLVGLTGSVILFSIFSFRAVRNLKIFDSKIMETSPGWAVGWYFIPIANLWKPLGVMEQIWEGSHDLIGDDRVRPNTIVFWWICWIVSNIVSNISLRMSLNSGGMDAYASNVELYKTSLNLDIFSAVAGILAALLLLPILKSIVKAQDTYIRAQVFD